MLSRRGNALDDHVKMRHLNIVFVVVMVGCACRELAAGLIVTDRAPSWAQLLKQVISTNTGQRLQKEAQQRAIGLGPPHPHASLRLFDAREEDVRVTFYRDHAAWCPYCQKVWLMLEEKQIPYRVKKVPLNAYGDKPSWFTRKVDGGMLAAGPLRNRLERSRAHHWRARQTARQARS